MDFEEQLLIGGLLMTIAVLTASHAHARPAAVRVTRVVALNASSPRDDSLASSSSPQLMAARSSLKRAGSQQQE